MSFVNYIPRPVKNILRLGDYLVHKESQRKYHSALNFWKSRIKQDNGIFKNSHFRRIMLEMAQENDENFLKGKIVADFGCGPRGSLVWASSALMRIGIDVLADVYAEHFKDNIISHGMIYVTSTETVIPLSSNYVDVLYTLNAIDHVDDFKMMSEEVIRIIKIGGELIASFNLEEPPTRTEPQTLSEEIIKKYLLNYFEIKSYRVAHRAPDTNERVYDRCIEGDASYKKGEKGFLWVRAIKRG